MHQPKPYRRAGSVIITAGVVWLAGIAMVGNVHATKDAAARLAMLQRHRRLWILGQVVAAAGTAAAPMGFARLAQQLPGGTAKNVSAAAAGAMLAGSPLFVASLAQRAADIRRFAYRGGPSWPFLSYAGLQTAGIGALGAALQLSDLKGRTGFGAAVSAPVFAAILARYKDIPPFVFYLVQIAAGVKLMRYVERAGLPDSN